MHLVQSYSWFFQGHSTTSTYFILHGTCRLYIQVRTVAAQQLRPEFEEKTAKRNKVYISIFIYANVKILEWRWEGKIKICHGIRVVYSAWQ